MELELKRGGRTARIETLGGELVSYRDESGREYIWWGDPAYWPGRNPLLFPIVGGLKDGKIHVKGREVSMERHGFARRREFTVAGQGEDWVELTLEQDEGTLELYPWPFKLTVRQQLTDGGFETAVTVANTGDEPMPFCLGAHTGFCCPLDKGEAFEDYDLVFPQKETCRTLVPDANGLDWNRTLPCLEDTDTLPLAYRWFDELDTLIFHGLKSQFHRSHHIRVLPEGIFYDFYLQSLQGPPYLFSPVSHNHRNISYPGIFHTLDSHSDHGKAVYLQ